MLGTTVFLGQDNLLYWQYAIGKGRIRYAAADKGSGQKEAFLVQCVHSERYQVFHCDPIVEWPIEE